MQTRPIAFHNIDLNEAVPIKTLTYLLTYLRT